MRIDLFLKKSRIIKRRSQAKILIDNNFVSVNNKVIKPSYNIKTNDIITIKMYSKIIQYQVLNLDNNPMYTLIKEERIKNE